MQPILIGAADGIDDIRQRLDDEFRCLQAEGLGVRIAESHRGQFTFLDCYIAEAATRGPAEEWDAKLRHYVANALSDVIIEKRQKEMIRKIIRGQYQCFSADEQDTILRYADQNLADAAGHGPDLLYKVGRKTRILHSIRDFLAGSNELVLEGFVTFRLKEYVAELHEAVDRAVDDFLVEREQHEFIRLLRYFVEVQEPRIEHVHVLMRPKGAFHLLDDDGSAIRSEYLEGFVAEMVEGEVSQDDLLISALITLAPRLLTLHASGDLLEREGVRTALAVFGGRVLNCSGCSRCGRAGAHNPMLPEPSH